MLLASPSPLRLLSPLGQADVMPEPTPIHFVKQKKLVGNLFIIISIHPLLSAAFWCHFILCSTADSYSSACCQAIGCLSPWNSMRYDNHTWEDSGGVWNNRSGRTEEVTGEKEIPLAESSLLADAALKLSPVTIDIAVEASPLAELSIQSLERDLLQV